MMTNRLTRLALALLATLAVGLAGMPSADATTTTTLTGTITDEAGAPIADAQVDVVAPATGATVAMAVSAADGSYVVTVDVEPCADGVLTNGSCTTTIPATQLPDQCPPLSQVDGQTGNCYEVVLPLVDEPLCESPYLLSFGECKYTAVGEMELQSAADCPTAGPGITPSVSGLIAFANGSVAYATCIYTPTPVSPECPGDSFLAVSGFCWMPTLRAGLNRLIDASLLHVVPDPVRMRFRFLEPIRQLAEATAERAGELGSLQSRHLEFYAASTIERGAGLLTADEERAIGLLDEDAPQVRAAWRHACAINDVDRAAMLASGWWWMTLRSLSHRDYSRPAETMDLPGFEDSPWRRDVLAAASMSEWARGRILQSIEAGEAALAIGRSGEVETPPFEARLGLTASYGFRERIQDAHEQMIALIREAQEHESWYHLSGAQGQVAIAFALAGLDAESHGQADAALESAERSENTSTLSFAHHAKAIVLVDEDPHAALSELYESIRLATRVHNRWHLGWTTATLAGLYRRLRRYEEAAIKLDGLIEHWLAAEMEPQFVSAVLESALLFAAIGDNDGVQLALTIANEGRTHHPMLPRDRSAIEDLRAVSRTPPPLRSESEFVGELRATLGSLTAGST